MESLSFLKDISEPIFYVTNDVAKGIGLENLLPNYHIICLDDHPLVDYLTEAKVKVFCLERQLRQRNKIFRSTAKIIDHPLVLAYIREESHGEKPNILYFKPSAKIDLVCQKFGFNKLGNSLELNRIFEDKVSFYEKSHENMLPVPAGEVREVGKINFEEFQGRFGLPLVIQFGRGWAGRTTFFIKTENELLALKSQFPERLVKVSQFIKGKTILNNACIFGQEILVSPPAVQINALPGFTATMAGTIGRQWPAMLGKVQEEQINRITEKVGKLMSKQGFRGYFGLDFLLEEATGKIFLSENNARLTASVPFYTKLELESGQVPLLAYHLLAFLKKKIDGEFTSSSILGSEVVVRNDANFSVLVQGLIEPGIYQFIDGHLQLLRKEYYPKNLKENEFWLTCAGMGRVVNPEIEIIRANFSQKVIGKENRLDLSVIKLLQSVKKMLNLKSVKV